MRFEGIVADQRHCPRRSIIVQLLHRCIPPQPFKRVELTHTGQEDVYDNIYKIQQDPAGAAIPLRLVWLVTHLAKRCHDVIGHRTCLNIGID